MKKTASPQKISIVGAGVVGQATGKGFLAKGHDVTFIDVNNQRVQELQAEGYTALTINQLETITYDFDLTVFTVSTPTEEGKINLNHLRSAANSIGNALRNNSKYHLIVVRSTVPPGTTENEVIKTIQTLSGKHLGSDLGACMNPEYLREISAVEDFANPWIVVIGEYDKRSGDMLEGLYGNMQCPVYRVSLKEAEMQKYVHNIYNAAKISFFNEMRDICHKIGVNAENVFPLVALSSEGIWNHMYGLKNKGPFDGMCLPKDTQAFLHWAQERGYYMPHLKATIEVNQQIKEHGELFGPVTSQAVDAKEVVQTLLNAALAITKAQQTATTQHTITESDEEKLDAISTLLQTTMQLSAFDEGSVAQKKMSEKENQKIHSRKNGHKPADKSKVVSSL